MMNGHAQHHGPRELAADKLTRSELSAMLEHIFYRAKGDTRRELAERMPDAYQRLTGMNDGALACLLHRRIGALREAGRSHVANDATLHNGHNGHVLEHYREAFGEPQKREGVSG